jgi:ADP-heptose:LPS heptosyltransferase
LNVGGEADEGRVEILRASLPGDRMELARNLALPQLAERLRGCGLFLGHDSGISHLAAAVGTPALLLFGPTDPAIWAPANPHVRVLRGSGLTMAEITVPQVLAVLGEMTAMS